MHNGPAVKIYYYLSFFFYLHRTEPRTTNCPSRDAFFPRRDLYGSRNDSFRRCQLAHLSGRDTPKARRRSDRRDTRLRATGRPTGDARKSRPCLARRLQQQHSELRANKVTSLIESSFPPRKLKCHSNMYFIPTNAITTVS
jgi:hypothetical protein